MKYPALFLLSTCLFISCKKEEKITTTPVQFNFDVQNLTDIYVNQGGTRAITPVFRLLSGTPEQISLSLSNIPALTTATLSNGSGIPTFSTSLSFSIDENMAVGVYPIKLTATSNTAGVKEYQVNLQVAAMNDCAPSVAGMYTQVTDDTVTVDHVSFIPVVGEEACITLDNSTNIYLCKVYLDCSSHALFIPPQRMVNGVDISGSGAFTDTGAVLHFRTSLDSNNHQAIFTRMAQ